MAEIRVRDAAPQLVKQLQDIATELREGTVTGCLEKLIPRYHDMKKRIQEQNNETGKLAAELRKMQQEKSTLQEQFTDLVNFSDNMNRELAKYNQDIKKLQAKFGTKKHRRPAAAATRKPKIVPSKKKKK